MSTLPRVKLLAYCVGVAVAQWGMVGPVRADSAVGVNTTLGNALNPAGQDVSRARDPEADTDKRTPTGQFFDIPFFAPEKEKKGGTDWEVAGSVEAGVLGGDANEKNAMFRMYKDLRNGFYVNNFSFDAEKADQARFVNIVGGGVGRDDQYYGIQFGRYNDWKVKAFYNETPHVFTATAKSVWSGVGTGTLSLPANLPPAGGMSCANAGCTTFNAPAYGFANSPIANAASFTATGLDYAVANRLAATVNSQSPVELGLIRKTGGVNLDINMTEAWKFFAGYSAEKRQGTRPFATVQNGGGGAFQMEAVEPINYFTHDFNAGVRYADSSTQFNLTASANLFRNDTSELVFDVPFATAANATGAAITRGRIDLYPDNEAYNIKGDFARAFPDFYNGRFTATVSWATSRQNDQLLPPVITSGTGLTSTAAGAFNGNFNQWNTTAALSQQSANARIDSKLADLAFSFNPLSALVVRAKARYHETDNSTNYLACNPNAQYGNGVQFSAFGCTGVWGRLINDGGAATFLNPGISTSAPVALTGGSALAANIIRNIPTGGKQYNYELTGDYQLNLKSSLNATYEREEVHLRNRERDKTWEDKVKLGYTNRALENATLRFSYEYGKRRGDEYEPTPYDPFLALSFFDPATFPAGTAVTAYIDRLANLRKYDVADRDQHVLNARVNYMAREDLDFGASVQLKDIDYPNSSFGRKDKQTLYSANLDVNYQPSAERIVYGFYSYQTGRMNQANVSPGAVAGATCNVGQFVGGVAVTAENAEVVCGSVENLNRFNPSNIWGENSRDTNHVFGIGLRQAIGTSRLDLNFTRSMGRTKISYSYLPTNVNVSAAALSVIGTDAPDLVTNVNFVDASLVVPVSKQLSARLLLSFEQGRISDWHYSGLDQNLVLTSGTGYVGTMVDAGPRDYRAAVFGVMLQYRM